MTINADGLLQYATSTARHRAGRSKAPDTLATVALILTALPILVLLVFAVLYLHSFIIRAGATAAQSVMALPFVAAALGAIVTGVLMKRPGKNLVAWAMSLCTIAVLLTAASPVVYSFTKMMAEEFCEDAPGGRGYTGTDAPEEVSAICDWARSG